MPLKKPNAIKFTTNMGEIYFVLAAVFPGMVRGNFDLLVIHFCSLKYKTL